jgi:hypothetical protein
MQAVEFVWAEGDLMPAAETDPRDRLTELWARRSGMTGLRLKEIDDGG